MEKVKNFNEFVNEGFFSTKPVDKILDIFYKKIKATFNYDDFTINWHGVKESYVVEYKCYDGSKIKIDHTASISLWIDNIPIDED